MNYAKVTKPVQIEALVRTRSVQYQSQNRKAYTGYLEEQIYRYELYRSLLPRFDTRVRDKSYTIGKLSETPTNSISFKSGAGVEPLNKRLAMPPP
jgi:hypothetical protein